MVEKVLIHGAGAVGAVLGWRLAQQGARVTVSCRSNYEAVRRMGFNICSEAWGDGCFRPNAVIKSSSKPRPGNYDMVIIATKQPTQTRSIIKDLEHVVSPNTTLCSTQNGITADHALAAAFPHSPIISAICYVSLLQSSPGVVVQDGAGLKPYAFAFGVHKGGRPTEALVNNLVSKDPMFTYVSSNTTIARWEKMIFNASWNPACALLGMDTMEMQSSPLGLKLVHALAEETYNVAAACGVDLDPSIVDSTKNWAFNNPGYALVPSMLRDYQARKPMEVDALCGALVHLAAAQGIHVPTIAAVERLLTDRNSALHDGLVMDMMPDVKIAQDLKF